MELLVVRHGMAEDREEFAAEEKDDSLRPLTKQGRWKIERIAKGLRYLVPSVHLVATSPFARAEQTARLVAAAYRGADVTSLDCLAPGGRPNAFLAWLREHEDVDRVIAVGHEPELGALVTWLITGQPAEGRIALRKGGACLLEFDGRLRPGEATLHWALPPTVLRRLAD